MNQRYQPLPISTGAVGVDRCGNVAYYAAPRVVYARASWPCNQWPPVSPYWWWQGWPMPPSSSCGCGGGCSCGSGNAFASVLTRGAAMANWMIANRTKPNP